ncbi:uncharacterized protein [Littorina saxatilis]|uniref:uncharacterized protein n=1 Tax=Littorina saxatilis TaxID=31220 RepID=UPI0038B4773F
MMELEGRILVYSILGCPHCMRMKSTLQDMGLPYTCVRLDIYPKEVMEELRARTGKSNVPQLFFNAHYIGGNPEFEKLINEDADKLQELIDEVSSTPPPKNAPVPPDPSTALKTADPGEFSCTADEYSELVKELKNSGLIKDHRKILTSYKKSFSGKDFVDWVVNTKGIERTVAVEMGQHLIDSHFCHTIKSNVQFQDADVYFRLLEDEDTLALNGDKIADCKPLEVNVLGEDLRKLILKLHAAFLSRDGKEVDYRGIGSSDEFQHYLALSRTLQRVKVESCSRNEKLAFFVNIYNALVIHANIVRRPPVNFWQRYKLFNRVKYIIGGHEYSLQDMENGVLRANRKGVGMLSRPFSKSDPRLGIALEHPEPLIHFGLVCGAKSCPPIKTYTAAEVMEQLQLATEAFLDGSDGCQIDMAKKIVHVSMIFKWYQEDFGNNDEQVVQWIRDHMQEGEKKTQLTELINGKKFKVKDITYDWSVNSK